MTAPSPGTRTEPPGAPLEKGRRILVNVALDADIAWWEKTITPPGLIGPDMVSQTTQWNDEWDTFAPGELIRVGDSSAKVAYSPEVLPLVQAILNKETTITKHFPNGASWAAFGVVRSFVPDEASPPNQPQATVTISYTNRDPVTKTEEGPVYTAPPPPPP